MDWEGEVVLGRVVCERMARGKLIESLLGGRDEGVWVGFVLGGVAGIEGS